MSRPVQSDCVLAAADARLAPDASATYVIDGNRLSADQCRALFAGRPPFDRQIKVLERIEGDLIVDVGCYDGAFVDAASRRYPGKTVIGIDYSDDNIRLADLLYPALGDRIRKMSAYRLEFADASIDCITMQEVLEHLEGAGTAIKEVNRVLRPGGTLIVSVPNPYYAWSIVRFWRAEIANVLRRRRGRPMHLDAEVLSANTEWDRHVNAWTPSALLALLASNGFAYVEHCYETRVPGPLRRVLFGALPFLGPTQILKVRKVAPAPSAVI